MTRQQDLNPHHPAMPSPDIGPATRRPAPWARLRAVWAALTHAAPTPGRDGSAKARSRSTASATAQTDPLLPAAQAVNREIECLAARIRATDQEVASLLGALSRAVTGRSAERDQGPASQPQPLAHWPTIDAQARRLILISGEVVARAQALNDSVQQLAAADTQLHGLHTQTHSFRALALQASALAAAAAERDDRVRRHTAGLLDVAHLQMLSQAETGRVIDALRQRSSAAAATSQHHGAQTPVFTGPRPLHPQGRPP